MPELPEVETIARSLQPVLVGRRIQSACLLWERTLAEPGAEEFVRRISGQVIRSTGRRGKFLVLALSRDTLLIHLRMSGDLLVETSETPPAAHHRLLLDLDNGQRLAFNDTRKFGRAWLVNDPQTVLGGLGPEPLDGSFTAADFFQRLHLTRRQLKPLLLDQGFLAGLGNIYTDEALHLARLHPLTAANLVDEAQAARLLQAIRDVLEEGIRRNGASIDWVYRGGDFQNYFRVYQRTGQPCPVCGAPVQRIIVGQRGTHYC
ncbi:MAG: DNA-formamidopyrimidine glycosylase, partial [Chloroflexi bacterium RBG_19FT_COMBO_56_12]